MNPRLQKRFDLLEAGRHQLLHQISEMTPEQLHHAIPGKWSVGQILAHLIQAEKLSVGYIRKKRLGIRDAGNTGVWEEIKVILLILSQRLPFKFKAPTVVVLSTPSHPGLPELTRAWDHEREELRILLDQFKDDEIRKKTYRHVRVGILNIEQALIFFKEHFDHHLPQINRQL